MQRTVIQLSRFILMVVDVDSRASLIETRLNSWQWLVYRSSDHRRRKKRVTYDLDKILTCFIQRIDPLANIPEQAVCRSVHLLHGVVAFVPPAVFISELFYFKNMVLQGDSEVIAHICVLKEFVEEIAGFALAAEDVPPL